MARPRSTIPWLETRGNVYYAFWYDPTVKETRRQSLFTKDPDEARSAFSALLANGVVLTEPRRSVELTVTKALDDYYREHCVQNVADVRRQEDAIGHLKAYFGETSISKIDIPYCYRYAAARREGFSAYKKSSGAAASDPTIRRELGVLTAAARHAKKWRRIRELPSIERPKERVAGEDDEAPFFSKAEVRHLIGMAEGELRWFIELAYYTGARRRSIENLTRPQVKWDQKRILLQQPGKKTTKKRQPIVPILVTMEPALKALWETGGNPRLFKSYDLYDPFKKLCRDCGFDEARSHPHTLRHSRATHLLQDGQSLYAVAKLLGDTPRTIEMVYGHHSPDALKMELEGAI